MPSGTPSLTRSSSSLGGPLSPATRKLYGLDRTETAEFGLRCLLARGMVERGVTGSACHGRAALEIGRRAEDLLVHDDPRAGVILLALASLTVIQNGYWRNEHTLWRHAVTVSPDSTWVQETVAASYLMTDELQKAQDEYNKNVP